jgi:hypothetical protein
VCRVFGDLLAPEAEGEQDVFLQRTFWVDRKRGVLLRSKCSGLTIAEDIVGLLDILGEEVRDMSKERRGRFLYAQDVCGARPLYIPWLSAGHSIIYFMSNRRKNPHTHT